MLAMQHDPEVTLSGIHPPLTHEQGFLSILEGPDAEKTFFLRAVANTIGHHSACTISLTDTTVLPEHVVISFDHESRKWSIEPALHADILRRGSLIVKKERLDHGDIFCIGNTVFRFYLIKGFFAPNTHEGNPSITVQELRPALEMVVEESVFFRRYLKWIVGILCLMIFIFIYFTWKKSQTTAHTSVVHPAIFKIEQPVQPLPPEKPAIPINKELRKSDSRNTYRSLIASGKNSLAQRDDSSAVSTLSRAYKMVPSIKSLLSQEDIRENQLLLANAYYLQGFLALKAKKNCIALKSFSEGLLVYPEHRLLQEQYATLQKNRDCTGR